MCAYVHRVAYLPPFFSRAPGMGCVFCKKVEPGPKEAVGLEGDFRSYGAADRYGPDPTQARPMSSLAHIPNYNNFSPQPTSPAFLDGGTIRAISGESSSWRWPWPRPWRRDGVDLSLGASSMARETQPCLQRAL